VSWEVIVFHRVGCGLSVWFVLRTAFYRHKKHTKSHFAQYLCFLVELKNPSNILLRNSPVITIATNWIQIALGLFNHSPLSPTDLVSTPEESQTFWQQFTPAKLLFKELNSIQTEAHRQSCNECFLRPHQAKYSVTKPALSATVHSTLNLWQCTHCD